MERFSPLLLDVWREVCRHIEIGESVARVAPILVRRLPVDLVLVRRIDFQRGSLETVATGVCGEQVALRFRTDPGEIAGRGAAGAGERDAAVRVHRILRDEFADLERVLPVPFRPKLVN